MIDANTELNNGQAMTWGGGSSSYVGTTSFYGVLGGKLNTQRILNVIPVPTYGNGDPGTGNSAVGIGTYSSAAGNNSIAIGYKAATTAAKTIHFGGDGEITGPTAITNFITPGILTAGTRT